jgi:hypothetical protein
MRVRPRKRRNKVSFDLASARTLTLPLSRVPPSHARGRGAFAAVIFTPRLRVPNAKTKEAIRELEAGKGQRFANLDDLFTDLHEDD